MNLDQAFRTTDFVVAADPGAGLPAPTVICIDQPHPAWDAWVKRCGHATWACVTAYNPGARQVTAAANHAAHERLRARIAGLGVPVREGVGQSRAAGSTWPPEPCFFVLGIRRKAAAALGREFGQVAVVWGHAGEAAQLVYCEPTPPPELALVTRVAAVSNRPRELWGFVPNLAYDSAPPAKKRACQAANALAVADTLAALRALANDGRLAAAVSEVAFRTGARPLSGPQRITLTVFDWSCTLALEGPAGERSANRCDFRRLSRMLEHSPAHAAAALAGELLALVPLAQPGDARFVPPGLVRCKTCREFKGVTVRLFLAGGLSADDAANNVYVNCACGEYLCPRCKSTRVRDRSSKRYVPGENAVVPWGGELLCEACMARTAHTEHQPPSWALAGLLLYFMGVLGIILSEC